MREKKETLDREKKEGHRKDKDKENVFPKVITGTRNEAFSASLEKRAISMRLVGNIHLPNGKLISLNRRLPFHSFVSVLS